MNIIFDLKSFTSKIYMSIFIILVFFFLYLTVEDSEFDNVTSSNCRLDRLYFTVSTHVGMRGDTLKPVSFRAKMLSILHMLLAYSILIL